MTADPVFNKYTTDELKLMRPGTRMLDNHGTVWTKKIKFNRDYWDATLLSTGEPPEDSNRFRTNSYMRQRMLSKYDGPVALQLNKVRKEQ